MSRIKNMMKKMKIRFEATYKNVKEMRSDYLELDNKRMHMLS